MARRKRTFARRLLLVACLFVAGGGFVAWRLGRLPLDALSSVDRLVSKLGLRSDHSTPSAVGPSSVRPGTNEPAAEPPVDPIIFEAQTEPPLDEPTAGDSGGNDRFSSAASSRTTWDDPWLAPAVPSVAPTLAPGARAVGSEVAQAGLTTSDASGSHVVPVGDQRWAEPHRDEPLPFGSPSQTPSAAGSGDPSANATPTALLARRTAAAARASTAATSSTGSRSPDRSSRQPSSHAPTRSAPNRLLDLSEIDRLMQSGQDIAALRELSRIYWQRPERRGQIRERLETLAKRIFFSPQPHYLPPYVVQPGDQLARIARQYKVSWPYLAKLNRVDPRRIRPGQKLKVIRGPFSALVDLSDFELTVHLNGYYVRSYRVGIGKDNSTPTGRFKVLNKVVNPQYTDPDGKVIDADDPNNPLGEYWLDLGDGYGIHGTIEPDSIGRAVSRGCIRMRNEDVAEVFDLLVVGSEVVIQP